MDRSMDAGMEIANLFRPSSPSRTPPPPPIHRASALEPAADSSGASMPPAEPSPQLPRTQSPSQTSPRKRPRPGEDKDVDDGRVNDGKAMNPVTGEARREEHDAQPRDREHEGESGGRYSTSCGVDDVMHEGAEDGELGEAEGPDFTVEEVFVSKEAIGYIIGHKGSVIKQLISESGAEVDTNREHDGMGGFTVRGRRNCVRQFIDSVQAMLEKLPTSPPPAQPPPQPTTLTPAGGDVSMERSGRIGSDGGGYGGGFGDSGPGPFYGPGTNHGPSPGHLGDPSRGAGRRFDDEDCVCEIWVPMDRVGYIIGASGATIRRLSEETQTEIKVWKNVVRNERKLITVSGLRLAVRHGINAVLKVVPHSFPGDIVNRALFQGTDFRGGLRGPGGSGGDRDWRGGSGRGPSPKRLKRDIDRPYGPGPGGCDPSEINTKCIYIPTELAGVVIGKGGGTIRDLQKRSGAVVKVAMNEEGDGTRERLVSISGTNNAIDHAHDLLEDLLAEKQSVMRSGPISGLEDVEDDILIPRNCIALLIGKEGRNVKELEMKSNASINVDHSNSTDGPDCRIWIGGTRSGVEMAKSLIADLIGVKLCPDNRDRERTSPRQEKEMKELGQVDSFSQVGNGSARCIESPSKVRNLEAKDDGDVGKEMAYLPNVTTRKEIETQHPHTSSKPAVSALGKTMTTPSNVGTAEKEGEAPCSGTGVREASRPDFAEKLLHSGVAQANGEQPRPGSALNGDEPSISVPASKDEVQPHPGSAQTSEHPARSGSASSAQESQPSLSLKHAPRTAAQGVHHLHPYPHHPSQFGQYPPPSTPHSGTGPVPPTPAYQYPYGYPPPPYGYPPTPYGYPLAPYGYPSFYPPPYAHHMTPPEGVRPSHLEKKSMSKSDSGDSLAGKGGAKKSLNPVPFPVAPNSAPSPPTAPEAVTPRPTSSGQTGSATTPPVRVHTHHPHACHHPPPGPYSAPAPGAYHAPAPGAYSAPLGGSCPAFPTGAYAAPPPGAFSAPPPGAYPVPPPYYGGYPSYPPPSPWHWYQPPNPTQPSNAPPATVSGRPEEGETQMPPPARDNDPKPLVGQPGCLPSPVTPLPSKGSERQDTTAGKFGPEARGLYPSHAASPNFYQHPPPGYHVPYPYPVGPGYPYSGYPAYQQPAAHSVPPQVPTAKPDDLASFLGTPSAAVAGSTASPK